MAIRPRVRSRTVVLAVVAAAVLVWIAPMIAAAIEAIDLASLDHPYALIATFVILDAVIPLFPSEYLLTAAATLIAAGTTDMALGPLIGCGAAGAFVGDLLLFVLARTVARRYLGGRLEALRRDTQVDAGLTVLGRQAGTLIVAGRFVPGLRFAVNATMGLSDIPLRRFAAWSAVGGTVCRRTPA
jgi:membrane protein DedA with SNARE-associated domain